MNIPDILKQVSELGIVAEPDAKIMTRAFRSEKAEGQSAVRIVAEVLESQGLVTPFQAKAIARNRADELVYGPFICRRELGRGGMGCVYLAWHRVLEKEVALKTMKLDFVGDDQARKRFMREVKAAGRVSHPNLVVAFDANCRDDEYYLAMELIEGQNFHDLTKQRGFIPWKEACDWIVQTAEGLAHAHSLNMVHRDIKPSNLMMTKQGVVKVLDLGLVRFADSKQTLTEGWLGTPDYMPPEQWENSAALDARTDIYSLGFTLHYLCTGKHVFGDAKTTHAKLLAHYNEALPDLREHRPEIPERLTAIFRKMGAKRPEDRYRSMEDVIDRLNKLRGVASRPRPDRPEHESQLRQAGPTRIGGDGLSKPSGRSTPPSSSSKSKTSRSETPAPPSSYSSQSKTPRSSSKFSESRGSRSAPPSSSSSRPRRQESWTAPELESSNWRRSRSAPYHDEYEDEYKADPRGNRDYEAEEIKDRQHSGHGWLYALALLIAGVAMVGLGFAIKTHVDQGDSSGPATPPLSQNDLNPKPPSSSPPPTPPSPEPADAPISGGGIAPPISQGLSGNPPSQPVVGPVADPAPTPPLTSPPKSESPQKRLEPLIAVTPKPDLKPAPKPNPAPALPEFAPFPRAGAIPMNSIGMKFVECLKGSFTMGSPKSEKDRKPNEDQVEVTLTKSFWIGAAEVTQGEWTDIMGKNNGIYFQSNFGDRGANVRGEGRSFPMYFVSYDKAKSFCKALTDREHKSGDLDAKWRYALPTEAQWEYACRAGNGSRYNFGNDPRKLENHATYGLNVNSRTTPVKSYTPNEWGLYDMHGNVWEWCEDIYYDKLRKGVDPPAATLPKSSKLTTSRKVVIRGGSWQSIDLDCRSARRNSEEAGKHSDEIGFRVVIISND